MQNLGPVFYQSDCEVSFNTASILTLPLQSVGISYITHVNMVCGLSSFFLLLIQEEKFSYTVWGDRM